MENQIYLFTACQRTKIQIILEVGNGNFLINNKSINIYFLNNLFILMKIKQIFKQIILNINYNIYINISGGGLESQVKALLLGLANVLSKCNPNCINYFQQFGFLTRDLRIKERKKYGLRKARKAGQYSKR